MKIAITVLGAPYSSQSAQTAYRFVCAALEQGHEIVRVFFYHDAVHTASSLSVTPQDEAHIGNQWATLKRDHKLDLVVCVAAALKRGILDNKEAQRWNRNGASLAPEFEISGLGQMIEAVVEADRYITFGA